MPLKSSFKFFNYPVQRKLYRYEVQGIGLNHLLNKDLLN